MLIYQGIFEYRRVAQLWTNARVGLADWGVQFDSFDS